MLRKILKIILIGLLVLVLMNKFFEHYALRWPLRIRIEIQSPIYKIKRVEVSRRVVKNARLGTLAPSRLGTRLSERTSGGQGKVRGQEFFWKLIKIGEASYYSTSGCLGCDKNLIMANGEKLNDSKLTVALTPKTVKKYKLLNSFVKIRNRENGKEALVKVTDTGGFAKYGRVADLSVATKNALGCGGLCEVEIYVKSLK